METVGSFSNNLEKAGFFISLYNYYEHLIGVFSISNSVNLTFILFEIQYPDDVVVSLLLIGL